MELQYAQKFSLNLSCSTNKAALHISGASFCHTSPHPTRKVLTHHAEILWPYSKTVSGRQRRRLIVTNVSSYSSYWADCHVFPTVRMDRDTGMLAFYTDLYLHSGPGRASPAPANFSGITSYRRNSIHHVVFVHRFFIFATPTAFYKDLIFSRSCSAAFSVRSCAAEVGKVLRRIIRTCWHRLAIVPVSNLFTQILKQLKTFPTKSYRMKYFNFSFLAQNIICKQTHLHIQFCNQKQMANQLTFSLISVISREGVTPHFSFNSI